MVDKKYYLVNKENNFTQFIFTVQQHHDYCITGDLEQVQGWLLDGGIYQKIFISNISLRFDGGMHCDMYGEDYLNNNHEIDEYYYINGVKGQIEWLIGMLFVISIGSKLMPNFDESDKKELNKYKYLLNNYKIVEVNEGYNS